MRLAHRSPPVSLAVAFIFAAAIPVPAADWPQWRGPNRDGISLEKGLLQRWPQEGPKLLWKATDAGSGYAAPSVVGDRLYLLANEGLENEFVAAISTSDGKRVWRTRLGNVGQPNQMPNFPAARSTPTVEGGVLYALSSDGDLACLDTSSGGIRWRRHLRSDFGGKLGTWAYAESPLIDGDTLVAAPEGYREQGRFTPPDPPKRINRMEKAWAYPVVAGGRLYLRDHGCLWCYEIRVAAGNN